MPDVTDPTTPALPATIDLLVIASHQGSADDIREIADVAAVAAAFDRAVVLLFAADGAKLLALPEFPELLTLLYESGVTVASEATSQGAANSLLGPGHVLCIGPEDNLPDVLRRATMVLSF